MPTTLELYAEAFDLQSKGRTEEAESRYRDLVLKEPDSPESRYARVQIDELESRRKNVPLPAAPVPVPEPAVAVKVESPAAASPAIAPSAPVTPTGSPGEAPPYAAPRIADAPAPRSAPAYPLDFVPAFSVLGMVGFSLAVLLTVAVIALGVMVRTQGRTVAFQSEMIKAHAAAQQGDDVAFLRSIADAKSYGIHDNAPNLLAAEFFLKKKDFISVQNELRGCPVFDEEVRAYIEKVKRVQKGG